jgi:uncharacterized membrane protein
MASHQPGQFWRDSSDPSVNVSSSERIGAVIAGGLMVLSGLRRRSDSGVLLILAGGGLIYTGMTGHCGVYESVGIDTAHEGANRPAQQRRRQAQPA